MLEKRAFNLSYERLRDLIEHIFDGFNDVTSLRSSLLLEQNVVFNLSGQKTMTTL